MPITSAANPRIKAALRLRQQRRRRAAGLFLAEGRREVGRALNAGLTVRELMLCPELLALGRGVPEAQRVTGPGAGQAEAQQWAARVPEAAALELPAMLLEKLAYRRDPEGLLAVVEPPPWTLDTLGRAVAAAGPGAVLLVAVGTAKPGNLGAMVRTADAAGCAGVLAAGAPVDALNPNAIRASTGAVFALPTVSAGEDEAMSFVRDAGLRPLAATPAGAVPYDAADYAGPIAIIIGPEDAGLSAAWLELADDRAGQRVAIPTRGRVTDSLNASTAAAVLLFEARRARHVARWRGD